MAKKTTRVKKTSRKKIKKVSKKEVKKAPIFSRIEYEKALELKRNNLLIQLDFLNIMKKMDEYRDLRKMEYLYKLKIKNNLKEIKSDIKKIMNNTPSEELIKIKNKREKEKKELEKLEKEEKKKLELMHKKEKAKPVKEKKLEEVKVKEISSEKEIKVEEKKSPLGIDDQLDEIRKRLESLA